MKRILEEGMHGGGGGEKSKRKEFMRELLMGWKNEWKMEE